MQYFEECYHLWRDGLDGSNTSEVQKGYQSYMMKILTTDFTVGGNIEEDTDKIKEIHNDSCRQNIIPFQDGG